MERDPRDVGKSPGAGNITVISSGTTSDDFVPGEEPSIRIQGHSHSSGNNFDENVRGREATQFAKPDDENAPAVTRSNCEM